MSEDKGVSKYIDPLLYVFARPIGSNRQYVPITLEHADTLPVHNSELADFVAGLREKGLECLYYSAEKLPSDLAQLVRKACGIEEIVEATVEPAPSETISWAERGWK